MLVLWTALLLNVLKTGSEEKFEWEHTKMQKQMLLHYFLGKLEAKLCLMSKYEGNIEGHNFVLRDRTCKNGVASDFVNVFVHVMSL